MGTGFYAIFAVVLSVYGLINYYIGSHIWNWLKALGLSPNMRFFFWGLLTFIASSFLLSHFAKAFLPVVVIDGLALIGSYWLAAMLYFTLTLLVFDLLRLWQRWVGLLPSAWVERPDAGVIAGAVIGAIVLTILSYGIWNARHPVANSYDLQINKSAPGLKEAHVVMLSDIHLGTIIHSDRLAEMVAQVNALQPDLILLAGDTLDSDIGPFIDQDMASIMKKLRANWGVYAITGNHEYIGGHGFDFVQALEGVGIAVLQDRAVKIQDAFYVIGRMDRASERFTGEKRKDMEALLADVDRSLPMILLDHQPFQLEQPEQAGIDLQLSGHTHRGQMFPFHWITGSMYEVDAGYLRKNALQVIVSTGYGTWGPPLRIGNRPEIVSVKLHFTGGDQRD
ncbi:metallophosphoesterase [Heliophilum fasciatum]|uniref:Calcineurin-like phosphoesterase domain-containing protein n=1 Tax=Heliophilum fasciatum TaxID=35700 RepID=A0A4R2RJA6_9FIRM|nr:metallophosphoesterase [Heliophilum fasciatum]MCW2278690.1 putative MPP superfamily phosphohydrolase [Heliophilum fasciatum]TCP62589.1 hypothetical protein EDD73_1206 [Heliophilum fasciatum]